MDSIRGFSASEGYAPPGRTLEDAPQPMRQELIDALYAVARLTQGGLDVDRDLYLIIEQSLGKQAAGNPMPNKRHRIGRDIGCANWQRVYDLFVRLWPEFLTFGIHEQYREAVNRILAGYDVAWDLGADGQFHRVLPRDAMAQIEVAFAELQDPRYSSGLALLNAACDAYDSRPRRDRDACSNAFDAFESTAKAKFQMPTRAFDDVLSEARRRRLLNPQICDVLDKVNVLRHKNFGHGMTTPFALAPAEVDFVYLTCIGGIVLFARIADSAH
jgi:hypothetical protein